MCAGWLRCPAGTARLRPDFMSFSRLALQAQPRHQAAWTVNPGHTPLLSGFSCRSAKAATVSRKAKAVPAEAVAELDEPNATALL